ncbi:MAG: hypothetical protein COB50_05240, partial [Thiotrichales bacterium]
INKKTKELLVRVGADYFEIKTDRYYLGNDVYSGCNPNTKRFIEISRNWNILFAAANNKLEYIKDILHTQQQNSNMLGIFGNTLGINQRDRKDGGNSLHKAAFCDHIEVVKLLLEEKIELSKNKKGCTAINVAQSVGNDNVVNLIKNSKSTIRSNSQSKYSIKRGKYATIINVDTLSKHEDSNITINLQLKESGMYLKRIFIIEESYEVDDGMKKVKDVIINEFKEDNFCFLINRRPNIIELRKKEVEAAHKKNDFTLSKEEEAQVESLAPTESKGNKFLKEEILSVHAENTFAIDTSYEELRKKLAEVDNKYAGNKYTGIVPLTKSGEAVMPEVFGHLSSMQIRNQHMARKICDHLENKNNIVILCGAQHLDYDICRGYPLHELIFFELDKLKSKEKMVLVDICIFSALTDPGASILLSDMYRRLHLKKFIVDAFKCIKISNIVEKKKSVNNSFDNSLSFSNIADSQENPHVKKGIIDKIHS